jgi:hypothetical protein
MAGPQRLYLSATLLDYRHLGVFLLHPCLDQLQLFKVILVEGKMSEALPYRNSNN